MRQKKSTIPFNLSAEKIQWIEQLQKYGFSGLDEKVDDYINMLEITLTAIHFELPENDAADKFKDARTQAFKLIVLFGSYKEAMNYLQRFDKANQRELKLFIHDACLFELPAGTFDLNLWQQIITRNKPNTPNDKIMRLVKNAAAIEQYVTMNRNQLVAELRTIVCEQNPTASLKQIQAIVQSKTKNILSKATSIEVLTLYASKIRYLRSNEHPKAAELFSQYDVTEQLFNQYLGLDPKDDSKLIPNISLDGDLFGAKNYVLRKLDPSDPRAPILGKLTDCCQYLGGDGAESTCHGISDLRGGFYVLCEKDTDKIVAQSWAWSYTDASSTSSANSIVLDSIESSMNFRNHFAKELFRAFKLLAQKLVQEHEVFSVYLGLSGGTSKFLGPSAITYTNQAPADYSGYRDSMYQMLLAHRILPFQAPQSAPQGAWTKALILKLCCHLFAQNDFKMPPSITELQLKSWGIEAGEFKESMDLAVEYCSYFTEERALDATRFKSLIRSGINPYMCINGLNVMHFLAKSASEAQLKEVLSLFTDAEAFILATCPGPEGYIALHCAARFNTDAGVMRQLLFMYPEDQRKDALMQLHADLVPVFRVLQIYNQNPQVLTEAMSSLPESHRQTFFTEWVSVASDDPITDSLQNCKMFQATIEFCPRNYLLSIIRGNEDKPSLLFMRYWGNFEGPMYTTISDELLKLLLEILPMKERFAAVIKNHPREKHWTGEFLASERWLTILKALPPHQRAQALTATLRDEFTNTPNIILLAIRLNASFIQEAFKLIPIEDRVGVIDFKNHKGECLRGRTEFSAIVEGIYQDALRKMTMYKAPTLLKSQSVFFNVKSIPALGENIRGNLNETLRGWHEWH